VRRSTRGRGQQFERSSTNSTQPLDGGRVQGRRSSTHEHTLPVARSPGLQSTKYLDVVLATSGEDATAGEWRRRKEDEEAEEEEQSGRGRKRRGAEWQGADSEGKESRG